MLVRDVYTRVLVRDVYTLVLVRDVYTLVLVRDVYTLVCRQNERARVAARHVLPWPNKIYRNYTAERQEGGRRAGPQQEWWYMAALGEHLPTISNRDVY